MKYIHVYDTAGAEFSDQADESFTIEVDEAHVDELYDALKEILDNKDLYDDVYEAMMNVIDSIPSARRIWHDLELYW